MFERTDAGKPSPRRGTSGRPPSARPIKAGDLLRLDRAASVQFCRPITVRVIREITERHPYDDWAWIEAYELNGKGVAVAKRELFVRLAGLHWLNAGAGEGTGVRHRIRADVPLRVPA
ncbi:hypothetical protein AB0B62_26405 [Micromonospora chalcea]|uniref:hypothetical protein n=1 Tax=Micromonospora chalcea TaxID=1874 RepID=UPI00340F5263